MGGAGYPTGVAYQWQGGGARAEAPHLRIQRAAAPTRALALVAQSSDCVSESVVVSSVTRPTANLGTLTGDAMLRMGNGMRAKFDEND